jgi:nickel-responsive transcriptional regulator NikR
MAELTRFGVSIQTRLLEQFDHLIAQKGYVNRSEAIRDLIRGELVEIAAEREEGEMVGTVTFVYNHHVRQLTDLLTEFQHQNYGAVIASLHVHRRQTHRHQRREARQTHPDHDRHRSHLRVPKAYRVGAHRPTHERCTVKSPPVAARHWPIVFCARRCYDYKIYVYFML